MPSNKRALVIGIDVYPNPANNLNSCVNDTLAFRDVLSDAYGFSLDDITLLHNDDATLDNLRRELDKLFAQVNTGDEIVFYQSSHGYRDVSGDTMTEVLCMYDAFFEDKELVDRTKGLPDSTLTVVLDSCHSGGLDKLFFPPGRPPTLARAKVFQPLPQATAKQAAILQQVSKFKFFGRKPTSDTGAVAKQFALSAITNVLPKPKAIGEGEPELNGVLFAACKADQTAAAGTPATKNLSAFTYGLVEDLDMTIALDSLRSRVATRLEALNMSQTPVMFVPNAHPILAQSTFITMDPSGSAPGVDGGGIDGSTNGPGSGIDWSQLVESLLGPIKKQYVNP
jgi:hypothetical protein